MLVLVLTGIVGVAFGIMCGLTLIDVWEEIATGGRAHNAPAGPNIAPDHPDGPHDQRDTQDGPEALPNHENMDLRNRD